MAEEMITTENQAKPRRKANVERVAEIIAFIIILVLLIIFIAQNTAATDVHYLGVSGNLPFGVAMLIAAAAGFVLALLLSSAIWLQRRFRRREE